MKQPKWPPGGHLGLNNRMMLVFKLKQLHMRMYLCTKYQTDLKKNCALESGNVFLNGW